MLSEPRRFHIALAFGATVAFGCNGALPLSAIQGIYNRSQPDYSWATLVLRPDGTFTLLSGGCKPPDGLLGGRWEQRGGGIIAFNFATPNYVDDDTYDTRVEFGRFVNGALLWCFSEERPAAECTAYSRSGSEYEVVPFSSKTSGPPPEVSFPDAQ